MSSQFSSAATCSAAAKEIFSDLAVSLLMALVYLLVLRAFPWLFAAVAGNGDHLHSENPRAPRGAQRQMAVDTAIAPLC